MANRERRKGYYGGGGYNSNLAYDLESPELFPDYTVEQPIPERAAPPKAKPVPRGLQAFAPGAMLGVLCAGVLLIMMIMSQIQLTVLSSEIVSLQDQVKGLKLEEMRLKIAYESALNLTEVEEYATSELGMRKPREDQVFYVNGSAPDKAVIHGGVEKNGFTGIIMSVKGFLNVD